MRLSLKRSFYLRLLKPGSRNDLAGIQANSFHNEFVRILPPLDRGAMDLR